MKLNRPQVAEIDGLASLLKRAGIDWSAEDLADALWLATHMGDLPASVLPSEETPAQSTPSSSTVRETFAGDDPPEDDLDKVQLSLPPQQTPTPPESSPTGIPIKAPAAPALRIRLDLARALRPLRRKVPSPTHQEFDEAATVEQIADQGIWSPVLKPAAERWLEVAFVVEDMPSLPLWTETIAEFQTLLERQGAFRRVTTWQLQTDQSLRLYPGWRTTTHRGQPRRVNQLWDPAGRRLVLLLSDCTSSAWQSGALLQWLASCGQQAPTAVVQLLPERLWSQTGLSQGTPVWVSALEPGTVTAKLRYQYRAPLLQALLASIKPQPLQPITVPVISLEAAPLKQWSKMLAGYSDSRTVGLRFDLAAPSPPTATQSITQEGSAADRVQQFKSTASLMAQRLAGLMAAAPVSPPIVNLIRQTLLPKAEPVHVAEVYMGGLMQAHQTDNPAADGSSLKYDFAPEVRTLLSDAVSKSASESVLNAVSRYISERLGLSTKNFEALLRLDFQGDKTALDFATIAIQTLERMGGDYSAIAQRLATAPKVPPPPPIPDPHDLFPLLQTFTFRMATLSFAEDASAADEFLAESETFEFETAQIRTESARDQPLNFKYLEALWSGQTAAPSLTDTQREILQGAWQGKTYWAVAQKLGYSESHISHTAYQLWQSLSDLLGKKVTKSTFREGLAQQIDQDRSSTWRITRRREQARQFIQPLAPDIDLAMVHIPAGSFEMGSCDYSDTQPQHPVTFATSFWMAKYPITQAQWRQVAELPTVQKKLDPDPSEFKGDHRPVEKVTWYDAAEFCQRLSQHTGREYRLPSEAEWEYACRAGTTTPFYYGETLTDKLANYNATYTYGQGPKGKYRQHTKDVGSFPANACGLYDLHGNVWEWCQDTWHETYEGAPTDGCARKDENDNDSRRCLRGGSWDTGPENCRSANRGRDAPDDRSSNVSLRVVCGGART